MRKLLDVFKILVRYPYHIDAFFRRPLDLIFFYPTIFLAKSYRKTVIRKKRFIAITGSLGKTTTLQAMRVGILKKNHYQSFSNYGFRLGENILRSRPWERHDVFEVGISRPNTMNRPAAILRPDVVVVTSIKSDHNQSFPTLHHTRMEKVKLVKALTKQGLAVLNGDDPNVRWMATQTAARVIFYGFGPDCDVRASHYEALGSEGSRFQVQYDDQSWSTQTKLLGKKAIYSMLATIAVAVEEKIPMEEVQFKLQKMKAVRGRLEPFLLANGALVIDDAFKGSLESIHVALDTLDQLKGRRKVVAMGEVEELPDSAGPIYRELGQRVATIADELLFLKRGKNFRRIKSAAIKAGMPKESIKCTSDIFEAIKILKSTVQQGDIILLKGPGSRRYRRIFLAMLSHDVQCRAQTCQVKLFHCEDCPLVDQDTSQLHNYYIDRLLTHRATTIES